MRADLFSKKRLTPGQVRAVAQRRFEDAMYLCDSGQNARANGAIYLGGFALECWLKALSLEEHPWLGSLRRPDKLSASERELWDLTYRLHDLARLYRRLPHAINRIKANAPRAAETLQLMCDEWTIYIRYSPSSATIERARVFLRRVKEIRQWLR